MYDEEFDWSNPNYRFQHPARLVDGTSYSIDLRVATSWVEDYWLELAQLAWNGYNEGYRGLVLARACNSPYVLQDLEGWLTDPRTPSFIGFRDVWYLPWRKDKVPGDLFCDLALERKVADYDPKSQLVLALLDRSMSCQGHFLAYCQDAYPMNAKECSDRSLNHMIAKYGTR